jgi:hypothetical protein
MRCRAEGDVKLIPVSRLSKNAFEMKGPAPSLAFDFCPVALSSSTTLPWSCQSDSGWPHFEVRSKQRSRSQSDWNNEVGHNNQNEGKHLTGPLLDFGRQ